MVQAVFYRGHAQTAEGAVKEALVQAARVIVKYPSLVVDLEDLRHNGQWWDADIRVLAVRRDAASKRPAAMKMDLKIHPEDRFGAGDADERIDDDHTPRRRKAHLPPASFRFANAALSGDLPSLPLEDIVLDSYELSRASEPEMKRLLLEQEQARLDRIERAKPKPELE